MAEIQVSNGSVKWGSSFVEGVKQKLGQTYETIKEAVPLVGQVEDFYAGSAERERTRLLERGFSEEQLDKGNQKKQEFTKTGEATSQFLDTVSDVTNVDRDLVGAGAFALETLAEGRLSRRLAIDTAGGVVKLMDAPPAQALTITDSRFIAAGVKQGIAGEPGFAEWMQRWTARRNELMERMRNPEGVTPKRRQANLKRARETAYNDVSTGPSRFTDDPEAYGIKEFKELGKQQHHLFPKQESYQFVERMRAIGDDDDVINLFLYAEELDAAMGGRLSNMLNMSSKPHSKLHSNRIKDGRQMKTMEMKNLVESAKSTDKLMKLFDKYIVENIRPSKQEAKELQALFKETKIKQKEANKLLQSTLSEQDRRRL